jgi:mono/diheme cytochrome c family protein
VNPSRNPIRVALALAALLGGVSAARAAGAEPVDFARDIRPLFERHCAGCHGAEKQRGGYRLDAKEAALRGGDSGEPAIVPGNGAGSPLVRLVAGEVSDQRMPPKGEPLAASEVALLRRWIDLGAVWPESASAKLADPLAWWSLQPLRRPALPEGAGAIVHPIDAFIRARLAEDGCEGAPEADRRTLIRRVTFDLLGLPPTPEEVEAFVGDADPGAYERWVDRLLASPHYGERWARYWLDIVHYGDTHGYDKDKLRPNAWPYRDYVIRAFNQDRPYRRFVEEQIAGDACFRTRRTGSRPWGSSPRARGISSGTRSCRSRRSTGRSRGTWTGTTWCRTPWGRS